MSAGIPEPPKSALIIGGGIGGLALGALLARRGSQVTLLEAVPDRLGGLAQTISGGGYRFPFGPRYLWDFGPGEIGDRFLKHCGVSDRVRMVQLDRDGFDRIYAGVRSRALKVPNGWSAYKRVLQGEFPGDRDGLERFFQLCERHYGMIRYGDTGSLYFRTVMGAMARYFRTYWSRPLDLLSFIATMRLTLQDVFNSCRLSPEVQTVLNAHGLIFAEPQQSLSFLAYVGATLNYSHGTYFPIGGMHGLISALAEVITTNGGDVRTGVVVRRLVTDGSGRISAVETEAGERFQAEIVVSNIDPRAVADMLTNESGRHVTRRLPGYRYSRSLTAVFLGVRDAGVLGDRFGPWNIWYCEAGGMAGDPYEADPLSEPSWMYLNSPTMLSPQMRDAPEGGATLTAFVPASYRRFKAAQASSRESYEQMVAAHTDGILKKIEDVFAPGLRDQIDFMRVVTPLEISRRFRAPFGNVYGKAFRRRDVLIRLPWNDKISNLYHVGQYTAFAGVAMAIHSAAHVYAHLTGDRV